MSVQTEPFPPLGGMLEQHVGVSAPPGLESTSGPGPMSSMLGGPMDASQVSGAMSSGSLSSEWYPPNTTEQLPSNDMGYENPYLTPYSNAGDSYPPTTFVKTIDLPPLPTFSPFEGGGGGGVPPRPRSSPSTFGPAMSDFMWAGNPLGIKHANTEDFSSYSGPAPPVRDQSPYYGSVGTTELSAPQPRKNYPPIAPNPLGGPDCKPLKRARTEESSPETPAKRKRGTSSSSVTTPELGEEDQLLMKLKEDENLPWKDIAARFHSDLGKSYQVPALQMRFKRLRERIRPWTDVDINALRMAYDYWEKNKFDIISQKMLDFGAVDKWPAKLCSRKWQEINPQFDTFSTQNGGTPVFSQMSTPVEGAGYLPPFLHMQ